ncbi:histone deacetylase 11 isoform X1 [Oreochromis niloticus]|uniref:histone deacetylase 11 isoform X1 n=1 Tax=Oreochromis niloticus TaxID=8128 RepID=UPI000DF4ABF3|nr:histone deacetylase 11 isoform X1 [Oreochromis niloticus]
MSHKEDNEEKSRCHRTDLYASIPRTCLPIVYHPDYNITFMGLEKLHPFDAGKWGKVIRFLKEEQFINDGNLVEAREAAEEDLLVVHTKRYLNRLKWSLVVATITEIPPLLFLPNFLVQRKVLRPLRTQTGGTIMAGKLAVERGWAINVGGGFHHCSSDRGGGFCAYADITLAIKFLFERVEGISRVTIIDLDAHQAPWEKSPGMTNPGLTLLSSYITTSFTRGLKKGDMLMGMAIIHLPPPCREEFLNWVEERGIWWKIEGHEARMCLKPFLNQLCMVEADIAPHNNIDDVFSLTGLLQFILKKKTIRCSVLYDPRTGLQPTTPSSDIAAHIEMFPPRCPGTWMVALCPIRLRPLRLLFARLKPASSTKIYL